MSIRLLGMLAAASQIVGCASIVNGQNQSVSIETRSDAGVVTGASCKLSNNKGTWYITSPGSTIVHRSYEDLGIRCEKEPLEPGLATAKSSTKAMAFGNLLFGGVIGAGVDIATGAAYDYPNLITVFFGKAPVFNEVPQAGVQTSPTVATSVVAPVAPAAAPASAAL